MQLLYESQLHLAMFECSLYCLDLSVQVRKAAVALTAGKSGSNAVVPM